MFLCNQVTTYACILSKVDTEAANTLIGVGKTYKT